MQADIERCDHDIKLFENQMDRIKKSGEVMFGAFAKNLGRQFQELAPFDFVLFWIFFFKHTEDLYSAQSGLPMRETTFNKFDTKSFRKFEQNVERNENDVSKYTSDLKFHYLFCFLQVT